MVEEKSNIADNYLVILYKHRIFGYLFKLVKNVSESGSGFIEYENIDVNETIPEPLNELVEVINQYSEESLSSFFTYNKKNVKEFLKNLSSEKLENDVKPYINKRLYEIFRFIVNQNTILLHEKEGRTLSKEDIVTPIYTPAEAVFNFNRNEEGVKYQLSLELNSSSINISKNDIKIICEEPALILCNGKLFKINDLNAGKIRPFFDKEFISIPKRIEKTYFSKYILPNIKNREINAVGFNINTVDTKIKNKLVLDKDISNNQILRLNFLYAGAYTCTYEQKSKSFTKLSFENDNPIITKYLRNKEHEKQIVDFLIECGLEYERDSNFRFKSNIKNYKLSDWVYKNRDKLTDHGIEIKSSKFANIYLGNYSVSIDVDDKIDWFDIKINIRLEDGSEIDIKDIRNNLLHNSRELKLASGSTFYIPNEIMDKYASFIEEGDFKNDILSISKARINALEKIKNQNKQLKAQIKEFQNFDELPEIADSIKLRSYQEQGVRFLYKLYRNKIGACLADDMGLGKTIQILSLFSAIYKNTNIAKEEGFQMSLFGDMKSNAKNSNPLNASLIIVPSSLIYNWKKEILKHCPSLTYHIHHGQKRNDHFLYEFSKYNLIITGYGTARNDAALLKEYQFELIVLDESQYIKNPKSKTYKELLKLNANHKIVMTGTPIENRLSDLWAQMNFINRGVLFGHEYFKKFYESKVGQDQAKAEKLKNIISPFILRRTKEEVAPELPDLTEIIYDIEMLPEQKAAYEKHKEKVRDTLLNMTPLELKKNSFLILKELTLLRMFLNHPDLTEEYEGIESAKFMEIIYLLSDLTEKGHKVLVFSSFVKYLNLFANKLDEMHIGYSMLTGQMTKEKRSKEVDEFELNPERKVFLISLKAGGTGLNLVQADYVFITDPWWNPAAESQAINRAHRIGQTKKVFAYKFVTQNSIEEKIQLLKDRKQKLSDTFIKSSSPEQSFNKEDFLSLLDD